MDINKIINPFIYYNQERVPQKCYAVYDIDNSPNQYLFFDAQEWPNNFQGEIKNFDGKVLTPPYKFIFEAEAEAARVQQYDILPNTFNSLLVNKRALNILKDFCPEDFQVLEHTLLQTKDKTLTNYALINLRKLVKCIDFEKSWCEFWECGRVRSIKKLFFKSNCMKEVHLARLKEFHHVILFSPELVATLKKEKIKGAQFLTDQQSYNKLFPEEYLSGIFPENPEATKRYFVSQLNTKKDYEFFKTRIPKIPPDILEALIDMTLSRSSFHKEQCEEIREIMKKHKK